jgi:hypothetical protein
MGRFRRAFWLLLPLALITLTGISPGLRELIARIESLEVGFDLVVARVEAIEEALFSEPSETVLLDDDFEDGLDPGWVQVYGTSATIAPTGNCAQAYFSQYANCCSLGLYFDEPERYDFYLPSATPGILTLYFYDDASDQVAAAFIATRGERLGVNTDSCPKHYWVALTHGSYYHCTNVRRRTGWHRVDLVRTGEITRGYMNHILVFETKHPDRFAFEYFMLVQETSWLLLDSFAIDDVRFVATE